MRDVLLRLEGVGLVDDEAFARQYAEHRFGTRREGRRGVVNGLRAAGISPELAEGIAGAAPDREEDRADVLARTRAGRLRGVEPSKAFARLTSLLVRRGYSPEIARGAARRALELTALDD